MSVAAVDRHAARQRVAARRRRARHIRQVVVCFSVTIFIALFATIYVQLASGNDPALSATSHREAPTSSKSSAITEEPASTATEGTTEGDSASGSPNDSSGTSSASEASTPTPMRTRQS
jgi:hypothetical protein